MVDTKAATLTYALEDYLETIYELVRERKVARVKDIAAARRVKPGSVTPALKRLADLGLVNYVQREYIDLTKEGEREARRVYARHVVLTRFFNEILQMPREAAESQACAMEHSLSDEGMDRFVRFFEFLEACPHGNPEFLQRFHRCSLVHSEIPACEHQDHGAGNCRDSELPVHQASEEKIMSVADLTPGQGGRVSNVAATGAIRQRLLDLGILPDANIEVERVAPAGDPVWIRLGGSQLALRRAEAEAVLITVR